MKTKFVYYNVHYTGADFTIYDKPARHYTKQEVISYINSHEPCKRRYFEVHKIIDEVIKL